jgi:hypothetical protein
MAKTKGGPETERHTVCRHCGEDILAVRPYIRNEWRDRDNNVHCPDGQHVHAPIPGWRS